MRYKQPLCCRNLRQKTFCIGVFYGITSLIFIVISTSISASRYYQYYVLWNQFLINGATCLFSLELIASITLVGGAIQKKSNLVVPWLAVNSVLCCVFLVFMVAGGLYLLGNEPWVIIVYIAASITYFCLLLHFMVAVHRFYQQLIVNKCSTASDRTLAGMTLVPSSSVWNYYPRRATPSPPGLSQDGPNHVTMVRDEFQHTD